MNSLYADLRSCAVAVSKDLADGEQVSRMAMKWSARVESPNGSCRSPLDLLTLSMAVSIPAALVELWTTVADL